MGNYLLRRLLQGVPVLFLITAIVFMVVYFIPGDAAMVVLGQSATPERLEAMRHRMGLDESLPIRYGLWLKQIAQGDLGQSLVYQLSVWTLIGRAFPITLYLTLFSLLIAVAIALPAGMLAALKRNSWIDLVATTWAFLGVSIPGFWLGIMLLIVFGVKLQWVPLSGYVSPFDDVGASLKTMILPSFTLGVFLSGPLTRYLRSSMLQTMSQEFVLVARAKGLAERKVIARHILRNSLIPFVTVIGVQLGYLIGGAVVIENVFALPGVGDLAVSAIGNRDYPVIQGVVLVVAAGFVLINIVIDVLYAILDPRIRVGRGAV
ncbi:MAG: peptide/nickel transport system permease protein [Thermomicrobiales bacterium]|jgi:peptide/nickel transport system permease protein|nr:peptide/nickel transport system permease protein [Thermomicrobiales bacterium]MEA2531495.1 peptide/nickel transport system permease protein [Thermomicrobiales bacterium]